MKRANILTVTYEELHRAIGLSDDQQIINVFCTPTDQLHGGVQIMVTGPECTLCSDGVTPPALKRRASAPGVRAMPLNWTPDCRHESTEAVKGYRKDKYFPGGLYIYCACKTCGAGKGADYTWHPKDLWQYGEMP